MLLPNYAGYKYTELREAIHTFKEGEFLNKDQRTLLLCGFTWGHANHCEGSGRWSELHSGKRKLASIDLIELHRILQLPPPYQKSCKKDCM